MIQTEYIRNLNCNYERLLLEEKPEDNRYQYCILTRGGIRGVLPCSLRYINGASYLYYDISSKQNVSQLYSTRTIVREWMKEFLWGVRQLRQELERFLLDGCNVLWYPEHIFQDLENPVFSFLYVPYYKGESSFGKLLEFFVEHIDYNDEPLVNCIYFMYEQWERNGEVYLQAQIFEDAKLLEQTAGQDETAQNRTAQNAAESMIQNGAEQGEDVSKQKTLPGTCERMPGVKERTTDTRERMPGTRERTAGIRGRDTGVRNRNTDSLKNMAAENGQAPGQKGEGWETAVSVGWPGDHGGRELVRTEERKGLFGIFENKRRREKILHTENVQEQDLDLDRGAYGYAVAEETNYIGDEIGKTVYMEDIPQETVRIRRLYTPEGEFVASVDKASLSIGKKKGEVDVVLDDSSVSRMHARIVREKEDYYLEDLNATNGTFKNGLRMQPYEKRKLEPGDEIKCGRVILIFR